RDQRSRRPSRHAASRALGLARTARYGGNATRNRFARGAATLPPTPPPSTRTANARLPRKPMNQAWVGGGLPLPNSAVPVLPAMPGGSPAPAAVPPDCTTLAMNDCNVATTSPPSAGAAADGRGTG